MGVHQQPSAAAEVAKLAKRLEELERVVRGGKTAPNFRDLQDADLTKAKDGEVPKYDKLTGRWKPGSSGANLPTISLRPPVGATVAAGGIQIVSWEAPAANNLSTFNLGGWFTFVSPDTITVPTGCWVIGVADLRWASGEAGRRRIEVTGLGDRNPADTRYSIVGDTQNTSIPFWGYLPAGVDGLVVKAQHDEAGAQTLVDGNWSITRVYV